MNNSRLAALLDLDKSHLPPDGGEFYNRLIFARSPYLLQHAENPVDWREWGEEAFAEARSRDIPLFVSIGYATCHWCHIMAKESFSDPEVAAILNEGFVPVKVDREERPDLDDFYMTASRALTGGGGWPLNVFIDHERRPFFSITYLPKEPKHNTPGFMSLLHNIATLWHERREMVFSNAGQILHSLAALAEHIPATDKSLHSVIKVAFSGIEEMFDSSYYGFGLAVKFPMPTYLTFLLSRDNNSFPAAATMAVKTLTAMMNGGIHDQLGGGFHRYTVDRKWLVPHFEKMLYDQAMLIIAYSDAFKSCGDERFLATAIKTAEFATRELLTAGGGFCAALDADSEGEEGLFYTWPYDQLTAILGDEGQLAMEYWGVTNKGDLDGRCILHRSSDLASFAAEKGISPVKLEEIIAIAAQKLLSARGERERPLRDSKVICAWNGLMIVALTSLYVASGNSRWLERAANCARFILAAMVSPDGRLGRNWLGTPSAIAAFAEDYGSFCLGLAELATHSPEPVWQEKLDFFVHELSRLFVTAGGEVSFCAIDAEKPPLDIPAIQDGVMPSTVSLCAAAFLRGGKILDNSSLIETGKKIIARYRGVVEQNPAACLALIMAEEELERGFQLPGHFLQITPG